jgi:UDP-N-acetylmuramoylalanine--D-glutamate ligase
MAGRHNLANALAALALAEVLELPLETCLQELREYPGLPHRSQLIAEFGGVRFINDSKATNPGATLAAIAGFAEQGPLIVILGGQGKGADFAALCNSVSQHCKAAVLMGEAAAELDAALPPGLGLPRVRVDSMVDAVKAACEFAQAGDIVLLSPACASYDMFENFAQRGQQFISAVTAVREARQRG